MILKAKYTNSKIWYFTTIILLITGVVDKSFDKQSLNKSPDFNIKTMLL